MTAQLDIFAARAARDTGMEKAAEAEQSWSRDAERVLDRLAASGVEFCADDVTALAGRPRHPNALGQLFHRAVKAERIVMVGRSQSQRTLARGRWQSTYVGRQA